MRSRFTAMTLAALLVLAAFGTSGSTAAPMKSGPTVGDLAVHLYGGSMTKQQAVMQLAKEGLPLGDPDATLTQGMLAKVLSFKGIEVTTNAPQSAVDSDLYRNALQLFVQTSSNITGGGYYIPLANSPAVSYDLGTCVYGPAGQCIRCCLFQGATARTCVRLCSVLVPSPSNPG